MATRMPWKEIQELAGRYDWVEEGKVERVNHNSISCSGDSKSMMIKREDNGKLVFYCHRCDSVGSVGGSPFRKMQKAGESRRHCDSITSTPIQRKLTIPRGCNQTVGEWHPIARAWLRRGGITDEEVVDYGLTWNERSNAVVIPSYHAGELVGYQIRGFDAKKPKYITHTTDKQSMVFSSKLLLGTKVAIVEDALSAIRVGRVMPCYALQGVNVSDAILTALKGYKEFYIWLDNDNAKVKMRQAEIATRLSLFGNVHILKTNQDPKEFDDDGIVDILS